MRSYGIFPSLTAFGSQFCPPELRNQTPRGSSPKGWLGIKREFPALGFLSSLVQLCQAQACVRAASGATGLRHKVPGTGGSGSVSHRETPTGFRLNKAILVASVPSLSEGKARVGLVCWSIRVTRAREHGTSLPAPGVENWCHSA